METISLSSIQIAVFMILGCIAEIAGFYVNSKNKVFTGLEVELLLHEESRIRMKTVEEMLQFARRSQSQYFKQQREAFDKISRRLEEDEEVVFTMLAEEYSINHTPGPWHVAVAVSNKRLFLSGETIKGQMFSHCGMDTWDLKEIKSVALGKS